MIVTLENGKKLDVGKHNKRCDAIHHFSMKAFDKFLALGYTREAIDEHIKACLFEALEFSQFLAEPLRTTQGEEVLE
jgi:hypothetical protein